MLHSLVIKNLALLDSVELEFSGGFQAVTGETGAGKSILLGALTLLSGARADKGIIRAGESECTVEAVLQAPQDSPLHHFLAEKDIPPCEEDCLILKRSIFAQKPGRQSINGSQVTVSQLQALSEFWIDFHGPEEPHKLFHENVQLDFLDTYAGISKELDQYQETFTLWKKQQAELHALQTSEKLSPAQQEFIEKQIEKISSLDLSEEYIDELERDFARLSSAQDIANWSGGIATLLSEDHDSILDRLQKCIALSNRIQNADTSNTSLLARLESLQLEITDLSAEYAHLQQSMDFSDEDMARIQQDMNTWQSLARSYGKDVTLILQKKEDLENQLAMQGNIEGLVFQKEQQIAKSQKILFQLAQELHSARAKAAKQLEKECLALLGQLGFKKAQFAVQLTVSEKLLPTGNTIGSFLFSSNPGSPLQALAKVASSGEMARVMLALKSILAQADKTPVLVFDEIDANVGGEIGKVVGEKLSELAQGRQVFCITHLPQVAGLTQHHWCVSKEQNDHSTSVRIQKLEQPDARIEELARMLGDRHSSSARQHAQELLNTHKLSS